ncbi:MAG: hypothetical protein ACOC70_00350 [bacterium]
MSMRWSGVVVATALCGLFIGCRAGPDEQSGGKRAGAGRRLAVTTDGGFSIRLAPDGSVRRVAVGDTTLGLQDGPLFSVEEILRPDGKSAGWRPIAAEVSASGDGLQVAGGSSELALELAATVRGGPFIDVTGELRDLTGRDRAVRLRFTLPVHLVGWRWENTAFRSATIEEGERYPSAERDLLYLDRVGPRKGRDPTRSGLPVNKVPFTVVAGEDAAIAMAYPVHEPRVFLVQAGEDGLSITFTLGLTRLTDSTPSRASFRLILYPVDPAWGIRSAAARYRRFFPELFASANRRHGNYCVLVTYSPESQRRWPQNAEHFGFLFAENDFQWTGGAMRPKAAEHAERLGLIVFHWRGPWYWFHAVEKGISRPAQLATLKAQAEGRAPGAHGTSNQYCGCPDRISAQAAYHSYLVNERGQLDRQHYPKGYGAYLMPMNMNPDLPRPNRASLATDWQYRYIDLWDAPDFPGPRNFAWDALDHWGGFGRLNFRREHFRYETVPLVFDAETGRLCIHNGFTHWAFAKMHAGMVRDKGGLIMSNCNLEQSMMLCGQFIDVFVKERPAKRWDDERLSVERMLAGPKPITFIGGWQPAAGPALEATLRKLLLVGVMPGTRGTEEQRGLMKKYTPVLQRVAEAGWQPVTCARADGLLVERFGREPGDLFFTVANRGDEPVDGTLRLDLAGLGIDPGAEGLRVTELVEHRDVGVALSRGAAELKLRVKAGETLALEVAPPGSAQQDL